ncbi:MAG: biotin--[acetyl-CoA-carboxylase] ligase [Rickettsiales bacterium]
MNFFHLFRSIDGTNAEAERRLAAGLTDECAIVAEHQREGRGKGARIWISAEGCAAVTFVAREKNNAVASGLTSVIAALALCDTVRAYMPESRAKAIRVKWPNDVYANDAKLAGILSKKTLMGSGMFYVVGWGTNVATAPKNIGATSLQTFQGDACVLPGPLALAAALRERWDYFFSAVSSEGSEKAIDAYASREYSPVGRATYAEQPVISATLRPDGALALRTPDENNIVVTDSDALNWNKVACC